jgi:hypothetical protein
MAAPARFTACAVSSSWRDQKRFDLMATAAPHRGDDRALGAARDVGLIPGFADAFDDMVDFLLGGFL